MENTLYNGKLKGVEETTSFIGYEDSIREDEVDNIGDPGKGDRFYERDTPGHFKHGEGDGCRVIFWEG